MAYNPKEQAHFAYQAVNDGFRDALIRPWDPDRDIPKLLEGYFERAYRQGFSDGATATDKQHRAVITETAETFGKMLARHLLSADGLNRPKKS